MKKAMCASETVILKVFMKVSNLFKKRQFSNEFIQNDLKSSLDKLQQNLSDIPVGSIAHIDGKVEKTFIEFLNEKEKEISITSYIKVIGLLEVVLQEDVVEVESVHVGNYLQTAL